MSARRRLALAGAALALLSTLLAAQAKPTARPPVRIVVNPDFLVSQDGDVPHVETMIAAHPKRPHVLVAGSIVGGRPGGGYHCKSYASQDGGRSWIDRSFPEQVANGGGDPQVAFTPLGTAIFTCLTMVVDDRNRTRAQLLAWRSTDGGLTWQPPADLGVSYDHEMLTADHTTGRFAGRVYLTALYGRHYTLGMFRSEDDGRHWTGPVAITDGGGHGVNVTNPVVKSDGTILVTWIDFPVTPAQDSTWPGTWLWSALSSDGGVTFSEPRRVAPLGPRFNRHNADVRLSSDPSYGVDRSEFHRDRLYLAFTKFTDLGPRVMFSRSTDAGASWSEPRLLDPATPSGVKQFMPRLAVNREGTVGVSFFDSRESKDGTAWHEYFTASVDGGDTFLPPVRVSSELSRPGAVGNERLEPSVFSEPKGSTVLSLISGGSRWSNGGDYLGLTVDSTGAFHPFWADARTGTYQLWTARLVVERPPLPQRPSVLDSYFPTETVVVLTHPTNGPDEVTKRVAFAFDPTEYDPASSELRLRVRLKNISTDSLFAPFVVEIVSFQTGDGEANAPNAPTLLNASNGVTGAGARFDFSGALGTDRVLAPGATSGAMLWRLKLKAPRETPSLSLKVQAVLRHPGR